MIEIELKNFEKLVNSLNKYPAISEKHMNKAIKNSLVTIETKAKREAPHGGTGELKGNWGMKLGRFQGALQSNAKNKGFYYGLAVEYGTKPHYVSPKVLGDWARRRGLNPFAVSKSIQRKGTKANPFLKRSIKSSEDKVNKFFDRALSDIISEI